MRPRGRARGPGRGFKQQTGDLKGNKNQSPEVLKRLLNVCQKITCLGSDTLSFLSLFWTHPRSCAAALEPWLPLPNPNQFSANLKSNTSAEPPSSGVLRPAWRSPSGQEGGS